VLQASPGFVLERIIVLSARLNPSNSQVMRWQPERIMANGQNYPNQASQLGYAMAARAYHG